MALARPGFVLLCAVLSSACALLSGADSRDPPLLSIAPEILGERALEQRLVIRWPGGERALDAALEIAGGRLRLALMSFGLRVSTLEYDGRTLEETRHLPQAPVGARMIDDLLLIAAPTAALRAALPEGWAVAENGRRREITRDGKTRIVIQYQYAVDSPWQGRVEFTHRLQGYHLILDSHEL
ncbi:MAG: DUF3261 domain-containing protein [Zoogloeaceae bacterium]|nr:DUF3261 domain-containing protein [Zoogloeaceae bacterium]